MNALLFLCGTGIVALLAEVLSLRKWIFYISLTGLAITIGFIIADWKITTYAYKGMVVFDSFSKGFMILIIGTAFCWFWIFEDYFKEAGHRADKTSLVLFSLVGALLMVTFNNMAILFLGIEILSISLYVLAGSMKGNMFSNEASFKYFLMGSFATGFLLFGIALVYGATGSFTITSIESVLTEKSAAMPPFFMVGVLMMMVGLAFKISAAPFHFWAPDVYTGSPTAVTAFMSTVVKIAAFAAFVKIFAACFIKFSGWIAPYEQGILIATLIIANGTAVLQMNVKRMLAYSSIGHVGYLLLALSSGASGANQTIYYYLVVYTAGSLLAFAVLQVLEKNKIGHTVDDFKGVAGANQLLAFAMSVSLLSLAGIPPLSGFFAKYQIFRIAIAHGHPKLVMLAVITSLIGVFYYFRPMIAMYQSSEQQTLKLSATEKIAFVLLIITNLSLSIFPEIIRIL